MCSYDSVADHLRVEAQILVVVQLVEDSVRQVTDTLTQNTRNNIKKVADTCSQGVYH